MARDFQRRMDDLSDSVGKGYIVAACKVNQPYAQDQHQTLDYRHIHGGRSLYLGGPLLEHAFSLVENIARGVITPFGSTIDRRMVDVAETMARYVLENAPRETGLLATSGNPFVEDNGILIYDRPPLSAREAD